MKYLTDIDVNNKKVLLRCDFNVSIKDNKIISDERIRASLPTIMYLLERNSKVIIMSHLGKVKTLEDKEKNSLEIVYRRLCELLSANVYFSNATHGQELEDKINALNSGEVLLVENTRFEDLDNEKESKCNMELAKYWASLADIFVNDAFALSHRKHASNYGVSKFIPSAVGLLIEKEVKGLEAINNPEHPYTIFMGGAKVEDKLDIIKKIIDKCDYLLVGGGIANSFVACNSSVGNSLYNEEKKSELKELLEKYSNKIILPVDFKVLNNSSIYIRKRDSVLDDDIIYDIGPESINKYKDIIMKSKIVFLNGTAGKYEEKGFETGTYEMLLALKETKAKTIIGGGDAISSAEYFNVNGFDFISTGGGATLEYIANGQMKCMEE